MTITPPAQFILVVRAATRAQRDVRIQVRCRTRLRKIREAVAARWAVPAELLRLAPAAATHAPSDNGNDTDTDRGAGRDGWVAPLIDASYEFDDDATVGEYNLRDQDGIVAWTVE